MSNYVPQEILVVCLVESSVALLHEWDSILLTYVSPVLQRIAAAGASKSSKNEFRIGFVSYSDPCVHPNPILARRFFSPVLQLTKELKDDPASLGIGRTASGGRAGMAVLEGYVAVLEMFDAVSETRPPPLRPHPPNEAQPIAVPHDPACYLIHVAASPPNKAAKPTWNTNPSLDAITWASLPSELQKRKIRSNMILTRAIPELQDLFKHISRTSDASWINLVKPCHRLLFSGLPPKDTKLVPQKRTAPDGVETPQQLAQPRPPSQEHSATVNPPAAATTPPVSSSPTKSSPSRPGSVTSVQPSIEPQPRLPQQPPVQHQPQPQPAQTRFTALGQNLDPAKLMAYIRAIENECRLRLAAFQQARADGKPQAELDAIQADINHKLMNRGKLVAVCQQVVQRQQADGAANPNQVATASNSQPSNPGQTQQERFTQEQPDVHVSPPIPGPSGQGAQVGLPHPGNLPYPNFGGSNLAKNPFQNIPISARPGMEAQMQKMLAERTRPPVLAAAPQTQPQPQQPPPNPITSNQAASNPNIVDIMTPRTSMGSHLRRWHGALAWPTGPANAGVRKENQLYIALFSHDANLRAESWPQKLILQPSRCPFNMQQIQGWIKELNPTMALISSTPIAGSLEATTQNARLFRQLKDLIQHKNLLAYCKFDISNSPPGTGFLTFPMNPATQGDLLVAVVFHRSPLPAALMGQSTSNQVVTVSGSSTEISAVPQTMNPGLGPISLQNMTPEVKAFLQQQQAATIAAFSQQQLAQHQAQQSGLIPNSGPSSAGSAAFNVAQFIQSMQGMQQAGGENPIGLGGLNLSQPPALQQVQHRQPSGFNPGQMGGLQMLQYPMSRRPDEGPGQ